MCRVFLVALLALVSGCASLVPSSPVELGAGWDLRGRIGVQSDEQSMSGQIHWQHRPPHDEILLISPLGQGVARITGDTTGVMLEVPGQSPRRAADADSLTLETLGYVLPVGGLTWWIRALPDPARPAELSRDEAGRVSRIQQDGWRIDYPEYGADGWPRKIVVTREGLHIRIVADTWEAR